MKQRNPIAVFLLPFVTFGIYELYWSVSTKNELNARGANIPTAWLLIVPIANIYWLWRYSEGVEKVTNGKMSGVMAFVLELLLANIGDAILQTEFNKLDTAAATTAPFVPAPGNPYTPVTPAVSAPNLYASPSPAPSVAPLPGTVTPENPAPQDPTRIQ